MIKKNILPALEWLEKSIDESLNSQKQKLECGETEALLTVSMEPMTFQSHVFASNLL